MGWAALGRGWGAEGSGLVEAAGFGVLGGHLGKEEDKLGDVVAVVDAVVAKDVAEVPEFLDDVVVGRLAKVDRPQFFRL